MKNGLYRGGGIQTIVKPQPENQTKQLSKWFFFIVLILVNVWSERERDKSTETILAAYTEVQCGS